MKDQELNSETGGVMNIEEFLDQHAVRGCPNALQSIFMEIFDFDQSGPPTSGACGIELSGDGSMDMQQAWGELTPEWLLWVAVQPGVLTDLELRGFAAWSVRQINPLSNRIKRIEADSPPPCASLRDVRRHAWKAAKEAAFEAAWRAEHSVRAGWAAHIAARAAWKAERAAQCEWLRANTSPQFKAL